MTAFICFLLTAAALCPATIAEEGNTLRIMTYNVHHCEGVDGKLDVERIANIIRKQDCDLVALQEVERNTKRSNNVDQMAELGRLTGMQFFFGKAIDYDGGEYGLGILSRLPIVISKSMKLPSGPKREQRIVLEVFVKPASGPAFVFACTHLDHSSGQSDRTDQNVELSQLFGKGPSQAILAGDFNSTIDKPELSSILEKWVDVDAAKMTPTIPVKNPTRKIDYIFVQKDSPWSVVSAEVLQEPIASDHLPLVTTLRLEPRSGK